jgi:AAA domain
VRGSKSQADGDADVNDSTSDATEVITPTRSLIDPRPHLLACTMTAKHLTHAVHQSSYYLGCTLCLPQDQPAKFQNNASHPLECTKLLVDEASMLDLPLAAALLDAVPRLSNFQLVLVGAALTSAIIHPLHLLVRLPDGFYAPGTVPNLPLSVTRAWLTNSCWRRGSRH